MLSKRLIKTVHLLLLLFFNSPPCYVENGFLMEGKMVVAGTRVAVVQTERMGPIQNILCFGPAI